MTSGGQSIIPYLNPNCKSSNELFYSLNFYQKFKVQNNTNYLSLSIIDLLLVCDGVRTVLTIWKKLSASSPPYLYKGHYPTVTRQLEEFLKEQVEKNLFVKYYMRMANFNKVIKV